MKNVLFLALALFLVACGGPEGEKVAAEEAATETAAPAAAKTLAVDTEKSQINWVGAKFTGDQHSGTIGLSDGQLEVQDGKLVGGEFTIDMTSMKNTDLPVEKQGDLIGHLSNGDFFLVDSFPTATFVITDVTDADGQSRITGNLTMRDITKSISIPATIKMDNGQAMANTPQFVIDRTQWGVMYASTAAGAIKDKAIKDEIGLQIDLVTK
ncbi:MAG: YceI family protein [Bacteroidota bacterium]